MNKRIYFVTVMIECCLALHTIQGMQNQLTGQQNSDRINRLINEQRSNLEESILRTANTKIYPLLLADSTIQESTEPLSQNNVEQNKKRSCFESFKLFLKKIIITRTVKNK